MRGRKQMFLRGLGTGWRDGARDGGAVRFGAAAGIGLGLVICLVLIVT
ncbi:hypothetical protein [Brevundimonas sp. A19_0]|nr:hypothetical protein [Brevundimonas sp. A19_0]MBO9500219.1 hypothetical protein [Brevundimonas sp. A19_0]